MTPTSVYQSVLRIEIYMGHIGSTYLSVSAVVANRNLILVFTISMSRLLSYVYAELDGVIRMCC